MGDYFYKEGKPRLWFVITIGTLFILVPLLTQFFPPFLDMVHKVSHHGETWVGYWGNILASAVGTIGAFMVSVYYVKKVNEDKEDKFSDSISNLQKTLVNINTNNVNLKRHDTIHEYFYRLIELRYLVVYEADLRRIEQKKNELINSFQDIMNTDIDLSDFNFTRDILSLVNQYLKQQNKNDQLTSQIKDTIDASVEKILDQL